jgi:hydroxypyruvate isomerase
MHGDRFAAALNDGFRAVEFLFPSSLGMASIF